MDYQVSEIFLYTFLLSLILSSVGFVRTVWFISLGYAFSIAALSLFLILLFGGGFYYFHWFHNSGLLLWSVRLGYYLVKRESEIDYIRHSHAVMNPRPRRPIEKILIWLAVSMLYTCMFCPAVFSLLPSTPIVLSTPVQILIITGLLLLYAGLVVETVADAQKQNFKLKHRHSFCNIGLYKWVRFPNYLGEILVWTGNFIIGTAFFSNWMQWLISSAGLIAIILIMVASARRLEERQEKAYSADPKYRIFSQHVPVLFPWLPLYSLRKLWFFRD